MSNVRIDTTSPQLEQIIESCVPIELPYHDRGTKDLDVSLNYITVETAYNIVRSDQYCRETNTLIQTKGITATESLCYQADNFPSICTSRQFDFNRTSNDESINSGLLCFCVTNLKMMQANRYRTSLCTDKYVHLAFVSPLGKGRYELRILIKASYPTKSDPIAITDQVTDYLKVRHGISGHVISRNGKEINQRCYLPRDTHAHFNPNSVCMVLLEPIHFVTPASTSIRSSVEIPVESSEDHIEVKIHEQVNVNSPIINKQLNNPQLVNQQEEDLTRQVLAEEQRIHTIASRAIGERPPLITMNGTPIIWPNTINVIQGKYGQGKSRISEAVVSGIIAKDHAPAKRTGIEVSKECIACYADTERNVEEEFAPAIQAVKLNAGYLIEDQVPNLRYTSIKIIDRQERIKAVEAFLRVIRQSTDKHLFVVLDVLTDCMSSFNDERQTLKLFDVIGNLTSSENATFLLIVHENPSSDKARGHAGTEASNKASTLMQVSIENKQEDISTDLIKLKFLKSRHTSKPDSIYFKFDEETNSLALADDELITSHVNNQDQSEQQNLALTASHLEKILIDGPVIKGTVYDKLKGLLNRGNKTVRDRVKKIMDQAYPMEDRDGLPVVLAEKTGGKPEYFFLDVVADR